MKAPWIGILILLALTTIGCRKTVYTIDGKTAEEWAEGLKAEKASDRTNVMSQLLKFSRHDPDAVPLLAEGLKDPETNNRRTAAGLLGALGPQAKAAIPALQAAAAADPAIKADVQAAIKLIDVKE